MFEFVLIVLVVLLLLSLMLYHQQTQDKLCKLGRHDSDAVRVAAECSLLASNSVSPVIALQESTKAVHTLELLLRRFGPEGARAVTGIDVQDMLDTLQTQKEHILQSLFREQPALMPEHPYLVESGYQSS